MEDVLLVQRVFRHSLLPNCRLETASGGREAVDYLEGKERFADRQRYPLPDVILLDLKMPEVDGFQFLDWLRRHAPETQRLTPVVVMSASGLSRDILWAYALGANSYMTKPGSWNELRRRLETLCSYWAEHAQKPKQALERE